MMNKSVGKKLKQTTLDFITSAPSQAKRRKMGDSVNKEKDNDFEEINVEENRKETKSPYFTVAASDSSKRETRPAATLSESEAKQSSSGATASPATPQYSMSPDSNNSDFEDFSEDVTEDKYPDVQIPNEKPVRHAEGHWKGVERSCLFTAPGCLKNVAPLKSSDYHTVMFTLPYQYDVNHTTHPPKPHPIQYVDKWDADHVLMPCSNENQYPVETRAGTQLRRRWELIEEALLINITESFELENAILKYNLRYKDKWCFSALHYFFTNHLENEERKEFFETTLKEMVRLALKLPHLCTKPIPLFKKNQNKSISLSQEQVSCLLANAFFCTFPKRNKKTRHAEYPDINFNSLFEGKPTEKKLQKLQCIIHYFKRVTLDVPLGVVTFTRQAVFKTPKWDDLDKILSRLHVSSNGTIEDDGKGMLQVDFANKFIGGGVLRHGCVQEEIRFLICPEMIVTCLFTEVLDKHDSLIMLGCEQYSDYEGYADSFRWAGPHFDKTSRDINGCLCTEVVAIDALVINEHGKQFQNFNVVRELNKAYSGFYSRIHETNLPAVCTGNWGCGAFGGDKKLKALIQLMAASAAKRDVCYFTFEDDKLVDELYKMHHYLTEENLLHIGHIMKLISQYYLKLCHKNYGKPRLNLFQYIYEVYDGNSEDTDDSHGSHENFIQCDSSASDENENKPRNDRNISVNYKANTP